MTVFQPCLPGWVPTHTRHDTSTLPGDAPGLWERQGVGPNALEDSPSMRRSCSATATFASSCPLLPGPSCRTHVNPLNGTGHPGITTRHQNRSHPLRFAWTHLVRKRGVPRYCLWHRVFRRSSALHSTGDRGACLGTPRDLPPCTRLDDGFSSHDCSFCFRLGFSQSTLISSPPSLMFPRRDRQQLAGDAHPPALQNRSIPTHPNPQHLVIPMAGLGLTHSVQTAQGPFPCLHEPSGSHRQLLLYLLSLPRWAQGCEAQGIFWGSLPLGNRCKDAKAKCFSAGAEMGRNQHFGGSSWMSGKRAPSEGSAITNRALRGTASPSGAFNNSAKALDAVDWYWLRSCSEQVAA